MSPPTYDLRKPERVDEALRELRGFWKLWSSCLLSACGLPTLPGVILTRPQQTKKWLSGLDSTILLIRHDKRLESPPHPRGGFLVGEELLDETIRFFFALDRIVGIYEPADPLLNMHNMNLMFENEHEVYVEIVGPGFDASDLQRGDLSPHETFSIYAEPDGTISRLKLLNRLDYEAYQESVILRKNKIRKKLESAPSVDLARRIRNSLGIPEDLDTYLETIGSPLCEFKTYQPVSSELLRETTARIIESDIIGQYKTLTGAGFPLVFSTSVINKGERQVFWDIVSPALKFEGLKNQRGL